VQVNEVILILASSRLCPCCNGITTPEFALAMAEAVDRTATYVGQANPTTKHGLMFLPCATPALYKQATKQLTGEPSLLLLTSALDTSAATDKNEPVIARCEPQAASQCDDEVCDCCIAAQQEGRRQTCSCCVVVLLMLMLMLLLIDADSTD
jgi:hypothetical protein